MVVIMTAIWRHPQKNHEERMSHSKTAHNMDIFDMNYCGISGNNNNNSDDKALMDFRSSACTNVMMVKLDSLNKISTKNHEDHNNRKHRAFSGFHGVNSFSLGSTSKIFPLFANSFLLKNHNIGISDAINTVNDDNNNDPLVMQVHELLPKDKLTEIQGEGLLVMKENGINKGTEVIDTQIIQEFARIYCNFMGS